MVVQRRAMPSSRQKTSENERLKRTAKYHGMRWNLWWRVRKRMEPGSKWVKMNVKFAHYIEATTKSGQNKWKKTLTYTVSLTWRKQKMFQWYMFVRVPFIHSSHRFFFFIALHLLLIFGWIHFFPLLYSIVIIAQGNVFSFSGLFRPYLESIFIRLVFITFDYLNFYLKCICDERKRWVCSSPYALISSASPVLCVSSLFVFVISSSLSPPYQFLSVRSICILGESQFLGITWQFKMLRWDRETNMTKHGNICEECFISVSLSSSSSSPSTFFPIALHCLYDSTQFSKALVWL